MHQVVGLGHSYRHEMNDWEGREFAVMFSNCDKGPLVRFSLIVELVSAMSDCRWTVDGGCCYCRLLAMTAGH